MQPVRNASCGGCQSIVDLVLLLPSLLLMILLLFCDASNATDIVVVRRDNPPGPLSVSPSSENTFSLGDDGGWSTFPVQAGTPPNTFGLLVSASSSYILLVGTDGCPPNITKFYQNCASDRGGLFDPGSSSSYSNNENYTTQAEGRLGITESGDAGTDTIIIGEDGGTGGTSVTVKNQTILRVSGAGYWLGQIGLNPNPGNDTFAQGGTPQSFLAALKAQNSIPSLSWGYTAGNSYTGKGFLGSLTLGGYDAARSEPANFSFSFTSGFSSPLVVSVQSIGTDYKNRISTLLPSSSGGKAISAVIDPAIADMWLPNDVCKDFEETFGLTWDNSQGFYYLNDSAHTNLSNANPNITITLGSPQDATKTINFTLQYNAFDLTGKYPVITNSSTVNYFPLKRAISSSQFTLGRVFLQEAYLSVDWERSIFNITSALYPSSPTPNLITISSTQSSSSSSSLSTSSSSDSSGSSTNTAAIAAGVTVPVVVLILATAAFFFWRKKRKARDEQQGSTEKSNLTDQSPPKPDINTFDGSHNELHASLPHPSSTGAPVQDKSVELGTGPGFERFEAEGSRPHHNRTSSLPIPATPDGTGGIGSPHSGPVSPGSAELPGSPSSYPISATMAGSPSSARHPQSPSRAEMLGSTSPTLELSADQHPPAAVSPGNFGPSQGLGTPANRATGLGINREPSPIPRLDAAPDAYPPRAVSPLPPSEGAPSPLPAPVAGGASPSAGMALGVSAAAGVGSRGISPLPSPELSARAATSPDSGIAHPNENLQNPMTSITVPTTETGPGTMTGGGGGASGETASGSTPDAAVATAGGLSVPSPRQQRPGGPHKRTPSGISAVSSLDPSVAGDEDVDKEVASSNAPKLEPEKE